MAGSSSVVLSSFEGQELVLTPLSEKKLRGMDQVRRARQRSLRAAATDYLSDKKTVVGRAQAVLFLAAIIDRFGKIDTYTKVRPTGNGTDYFFYLRDATARAFARDTAAAHEKQPRTIIQANERRMLLDGSSTRLLELGDGTWLSLPTTVAALRDLSPMALGLDQPLLELHQALMRDGHRPLHTNIAEFFSARDALMVRRHMDRIQGKDAEHPPMPLDFMKGTPLSYDAESEDPVGYYNALKEQTEEAAKVLLNIDRSKKNRKAVRFMKTLLSCLVGENVLQSSSVRRDQRYLFLTEMKGGDKVPDMKDDDYAVVKGTTLCLPYDASKRRFYVPLPDAERLYFPVRYGELEHIGLSSFRHEERRMLEQALDNMRGNRRGVGQKAYEGRPSEPGSRPYSQNKAYNKRIAKERRLMDQPIRWEWTSTHTGPWQDFKPASPAEALYTRVNAATVLEAIDATQKKKFYVYNPPSHARAERVREAHAKDYVQFQQAAIKACVRDWARFVPEQDLRAFFARQHLSQGAHRKVWESAMSVHHKNPISCGGTNGGEKTALGHRPDSRVTIDNKVHELIHKNHTTTLKQVKRCLAEFGLEKDMGLEDYRRVLMMRPDIIEALKEIPDVKVKFGVLAVGITAPKGLYCIPSLTLFELAKYGETQEGQTATAPEESTKRKARIPARKAALARKATGAQAELEETVRKTGARAAAVSGRKQAEVSLASSMRAVANTREEWNYKAEHVGPWQNFSATSPLEALRIKVNAETVVAAIEKTEGLKYYLYRPLRFTAEKRALDEQAKTYDAFRTSAERACARVWGEAIPRDEIKEFLARQTTLRCDGRKETAPAMVAHQKDPFQRADGGTYRDQRVWVDAEVHALIVKRYQKTIDQIDKCFAEHGLGDKLSYKLYPEVLLMRPDIVAELRQIPGVRVHGSKLLIGVIAPKGSCCVSSLTVWEKAQKVEPIVPASQRNATRNKNKKTCG